MILGSYVFINFQLKHEEIKVQNCAAAFRNCLLSKIIPFLYAVTIFGLSILVQWRLNSV